MYWRGAIILVLLLCGSQGLGDKPKEDLLKTAIQETEDDESSINAEEEAEEAKTKQAKKLRPDHSESDQPLERTVSSSEQNFDLGDVIITISERELEETPGIYRRKTDSRDSTVLNVRKKPQRRTSSVRSQKKRPQETPSEQ